MWLETIGVPVLLKAVEFLFGEGSKILQARRERRKDKQKSDGALPNSVSTAKVDISKPVIYSKDEAIKTKIDQDIWKKTEKEVEHLLSLLQIHTRNYYLSEEQYAKWGSALVPPIIVNNLKEAEDAVADTIEKLQSMLGKIYDRQIVLSREIKRIQND